MLYCQDACQAGRAGPEPSGLSRTRVRRSADVSSQSLVEYNVHARRANRIHPLRPLIMATNLHENWVRNGWQERLDQLLDLLTDYDIRSEEHTSELQSLMRISYAVFCLKKTNKQYR